MVNVPAVQHHQVLHVVWVGAEHHTQDRVQPLGGGVHSPAEQGVAVRHQDLLAALLQVVVSQDLYPATWAHVSPGRAQSSPPTP